jgi:hypothetical protein
MKKLFALILAAVLLGGGLTVVPVAAAHAAPNVASILATGPKTGSLPKVTFTKVSSTKVKVQWPRPTGYTGTLTKYVLKQSGKVVFQGLTNSYTAIVPSNSVTLFTVYYYVTLGGQTVGIGAGYNYVNGTPPPPPAPDPATLAKITLPSPTLVSRTTTSLTVTWGKPTVTGVLKPGYTVRAYDAGGRVAAAVVTAGYTATLSGLQPGVLYAVNLYAVVVSQDGTKSVTGLSTRCIATAV